MIGIDTNVLLRMFIDDNPTQVEQVREFLSERSGASPAFITTIVVAELAWVLADTYGYPHRNVVDALGVLLESPDFVVEHADVLESAIEQAREATIDIADALIAGVAAKAGSEFTATFDKTAAKHVAGMTLLK